ncbi:hypothetical protein ACFS2C_26480 [Prauserella oleivorans]|uniref:Integrase SAM-like N-terminal domain-containing protein n=1 Tax=Prauserella oleivorans TaxID=1478153 RepID=A0ABW5WGS0_9PSEU
MKVYTGLDPLTGKPMYLRESTTDEREAERILTRLVAQVDAERHAKTNGTLSVAIDEWLKVLEVEDSTREAYEMYARRYIKPVARSREAGAHPWPGHHGAKDRQAGENGSGVVINGTELHHTSAKCDRAMTASAAGAR